MNREETIKFLTLDEITRLIKSILSKRDKAIFLISYRHALRASEVGLLRVADVDLKSLTIRLTRLKNSLGGVHPLQADETRIIKAWLKEKGSDQAANPHLFPSNRNTPISRRMLDVLMKSYCDLAKIDKNKAHFHALKHSIATHLLSAGRELREIQDWLGHRQISNTVIYTALTSEKRDKMARDAFAKLPRF